MISDSESISNSKWDEAGAYKSASGISPVIEPRSCKIWTAFGAWELREQEGILICKKNLHVDDGVSLVCAYFGSYMVEYRSEAAMILLLSFCFTFDASL